jgi:hypothetical protein
VALGRTAAPAPNGSALQTLGRRFAWFNGYTPMQSIGLYATDGTSDGPSYGELGVPAFTFELGTSFFQSCTTYNNVIKPGNLPALIYAAKVVRSPYLLPAGPDVTTLTVGSGAPVPVGTPVTLSGSVTDTRFNQSNGSEPVQSIVAAEAFVDTPPWAPGAVAIPLAPADGAFDSPTEALTASLDTSGLAVGRHMVYVRGLDASGRGDHQRRFGAGLPRHGHRHRQALGGRSSRARRVPHHLIDIRDPRQAYSAARVRAAMRAGWSARSARAGGCRCWWAARCCISRRCAKAWTTCPRPTPPSGRQLDAEAAPKGWPALHAELARVDPATAARLAPNDSQRIQRALEVWPHQRPTAVGLAAAP